MKKEELISEAKRMNDYLNTKPGSEPNDLIARIEELGVLISQSGECLAQAKFYRDQMLHSEIMKAIEKGYTEKLTPSALNKFIGALAKDENFLVNKLDRINASATHMLDGTRSILSYRKSEISAFR